MMTISDSLRMAVSVTLLAVCSYGWGVLSAKPEVERAFTEGVTAGRKQVTFDRGAQCLAYWFGEQGNGAALRERVCGRSTK